MQFSAKSKPGPKYVFFASSCLSPGLLVSLTTSKRREIRALVSQMAGNRRVELIEVV